MGYFYCFLFKALVNLLKTSPEWESERIFTNQQNSANCRLHTSVSAISRGTAFTSTSTETNLMNGRITPPGDYPSSFHSVVGEATSDGNWPSSRFDTGGCNGAHFLGDTGARLTSLKEATTAAPLSPAAAVDSLGYRKSDNTGLLATAASASQLHLVGEHIACAGNGHLSNGGGDVSFSVDEWSNDMELDQCVKATCKAGKRYPVFQIRL